MLQSSQPIYSRRQKYSFEGGSQNVDLLQRGFELRKLTRDAK